MKVYKKFSPQGKEKNKKMQMHGNYRLIKKDGRIGWNALEKQAVIELLERISSKMNTRQRYMYPR